MINLLNIPEAMSIALHICLFLADSGDGFVSTRMIAERLGFSVNHSSKVVQQLGRAGILRTSRGPSGGARLACPASQISLWDVCVATAGQTRQNTRLLGPEVCKGALCVLGALLHGEQERLTTCLKEMTLADVALSLGCRFKE